MGAAAFVVFLALQRREFYGDGGLYLFAYLEGARDAVAHALVFRALQIGDAIASMLGTSLLAGATIVSAACVSIGAVCIHAGGRRLGAGRSQALALTLLVLACPAVLLQATVYELHGLFFAFVGAAFFTMSVYVRRPAVRRALLLGVVSGSSYFAHATGVLLVGVTAAFGAALVVARSAEPRAALRAELVRGLLALVASWATIGFGLLVLQQLGSAASLAGALEIGADHSERLRAGRGIQTLWYEWLLPFVPVSVAWLAAWRRPALRWSQAAFAVCVAVYMALSFTVLGGTVEYGAYVLPLAAPAAWLTLQGVALSRVAWLVVLGTLTFVQWIPGAERSTVLDRSGRAISNLAEERAFFLIADYVDLEPFVVEAPEAEWFGLRLLTELAPDIARTLTAEIGVAVHAKLAEGRRVLVTSRAGMLLRGELRPEANPAAALVREALLRAFRMEPLQVPGLDPMVELLPH